MCRTVIFILYFKLLLKQVIGRRTSVNMLEKAREMISYVTIIDVTINHGSGRDIALGPRKLFHLRQKYWLLLEQVSIKRVRYVTIGMSLRGAYGKCCSNVFPGILDQNEVFPCQARHHEHQEIYV